jgi:hypothetical protein
MKAAGHQKIMWAFRHSKISSHFIDICPQHGMIKENSMGLMPRKKYLE